VLDLKCLYLLNGYR